MTNERDYYEVLGVERDADDAALKSAYRRLALMHHPDRNPNNPDAAEKFKEASEAYAILSDGEKRARYDRFGHAGVGASSRLFGIRRRRLRGSLGALRRDLRIRRGEALADRWVPRAAATSSTA